MRQLVVKLNEGVSGEGNATSISPACPRPVTPAKRAAHRRAHARDAVRAAMTPPTTRYMAKLAERGGIVEERIAGQRLPQPERAAARDAAGRRRAAVDARSDAGRSERPDVSRLPVPGERRIRAGDHARGAQGRPPADGGGRARPLRRSTSSPCATISGEWEVYAIEINLRKGGTTHPFLTLQFLTDGAYDPEHGVVHHAARRVEVLRRQRSPRVAGLPRLHARAICSTSSCATACTSISRARRASCST